MSIRIGFKQIMYVYALEDVTNPSSLKVAIPDVFVDKDYNNIEVTRVNRGSTSIYRNKIPPALTNVHVDKNYIDLPVIKEFSGVSNIVGVTMSVESNSLVVNNGEKTSYPISVGIGEVKKGDRLIALFINENPNHGLIIGRC